MLGRFLELSIATLDIQASLSFYTKLGFACAEVGEAWQHPYAVMTDGRLNIGLHQDALEETCLTFVKPDLLSHLGELERQGAEFEIRRLGNEVFNEVAWRDPSGHLIRLVEARTFSPRARSPRTPAAHDPAPCGYFLGIALPTLEIGAARKFWERFGFVALDEPDAPLAQVSCTSDTVELGLCAPGALAGMGLLFEVPALDAARAALRGLGIAPVARRLGADHGASLILVSAPEGTPLLLAPANHLIEE